MAKKHYVIIVSGLGDHKLLLTWCTKWWRKRGFEPIVFLPQWNEGTSFRPKLDRLLKLIDEKIAEGKVSLVGASAGASAALMAYLNRRHHIHKVVSVCGRLRTGKGRWISSMESLAKNSMAFKESVKMAEQEIEKLSVKDKAKILTVRPKFGDELIPSDTARLEGVKDIVLPIIEHMISIGAALTIFGNKIMEFLAQDELTEKV